MQPINFFQTLIQSPSVEAGLQKAKIRVYSAKFFPKNISGTRKCQARIMCCGYFSLKSRTTSKALLPEKLGKLNIKNEVKKI